MFETKKLALVVAIYFLMITFTVTLGVTYTPQTKETNKNQEEFEKFKTKTEGSLKEKELLRKIKQLHEVNSKGQTDLEKLSKAIIKYSKEFDIPPEILVGIAHVESRFNKYVEYKGCIGLYQLNERVHKLDQEIKYDEDYQVMKGCEILTWFLKIYDYDMMKGLNGYNGRAYNNSYADRVMRISNMIKQME